MTKWKIYNEDVIEWAKNYKKGKFHALLCDPPYHLTSIVKRFGKTKESDDNYTSEKVRNRSDGYSRLIATGFMGQTWDGGDIAFRPDTWAVFHDVLFPGAFGMAFSASRNWHRLAVAIEDAGYIIHPTIFLWAQGQGFPKATNISKQIQPASKQKVVGSKLGRPGYSLTDAENQGNTLQWSKSKRSGKKETEILEPTDGTAKAWVGHRYGLQALKPAVEPIIVFQKPYDGKPLDNITETGAGALNIDRARIGVEGGGTNCDNRDENGNCLGHNNGGRSTENPTVHSPLRVINRFTDGAKPWGNGAGHEYETELTSQGRWPSNLILEEGSAQALDAQTGNLTSGKPVGKKKAGTGYHENYGEIDVTGFGDNGGASRFFYVVQEKLDESDPVYYCGKVSKKERNAGVNGNNKHPTLKPIDLAKYLATLLLPPEEYAPRRILVPFSGVASEMIGAGLAGWEQIVGIENDTKNGYINIAEERLEHWLK